MILNLGIDKEKGDGAITVNPLSRSGFNDSFGGQVGSYSESWYDNSNENLNAQLNYTKTFGKFNLDILAGYEYQQFDFENFNSGNIKLYGIDPSQIPDVYTDPGNNLQAFLVGLYNRINKPRY